MGFINRWQIFVEIALRIIDRIRTENEEQWRNGEKNEERHPKNR